MAGKAMHGYRSTIAGAQRGVTLIELIVVIIIIGVSIAVGVPSFQAMRDGAQLRSTSADLQAALNTARNQSVSLRMNVLVNPIDGDWNRGWTVEYDWPAGTPVAQQFEEDLRMEQGGDVQVNGPGAGITFQPGGLVAGGAANFSLCSGKRGRNISITPLGRITGEERAC